MYDNICNFNRDQYCMYANIGNFNRYQYYMNDNICMANTNTLMLSFGDNCDRN